MQERHLDRQRYFHELENTSREFYVKYLATQQHITAQSKVLEVGCGDGGNLVPFAEMGCTVTGMDIAQCRINDAQTYFKQVSPKATFTCCDFLACTPPTDTDDKYDVILLHDVIEHINQKADFLKQLKAFLKLFLPTNCRNDLLQVYCLFYNLSYHHLLMGHRLAYKKVQA